ncbi:MAG: hypothetical protein WCW52_01045 [Elusimicrobiales bacterium]|jgi:hypothetical protein
MKTRIIKSFTVVFTLAVLVYMAVSIGQTRNAVALTSEQAKKTANDAANDAKKTIKASTMPAVNVNVGDISGSLGGVKFGCCG